MNNVRSLLIPAALLAASVAGAQISPFPLTQSGLVISRPSQLTQPFTVAGERGVLVGTQDGQFESWILPVKLLSHLTIEANVEGYSVPIAVNAQSANIEVRPDRTTLTYSHIAFTLRQIMFSPDGAASPNTPTTGPIVLFQIDSPHALDLTFRFTPEMRWMWPRRNDGIPSPDWVSNQTGGYYSLHMDYPDLASAVTIPTATPGILAPYQERPQVHPLELRLHYDPKRDGQGMNAKYFPLLMAVGTTPETGTNAALGETLARLNAEIPALYKAHAAYYAKLLSETTSIETPDKALDEAFQWGVVSVEQLKAHEFASNQNALVAGYYASGDSARPGFGWFFGRDALYTLYAVDSFGDFTLTRSELEFLVSRQREDGKIMHEFAQTAADPSVNWKQFPYMYAAADATPLFLMAMRDYYRTSGDLAFLKKYRETIEKAWAFETAASSDGDHDGIYDNSQGTGWVESWPAGPTAGSNNLSGMPHQEIYMALLDEQASQAYAALESALANPEQTASANKRAEDIRSKIESEYYDREKGCYAFATNPLGSAHAPVDRSTTVYPAIAWWDDNNLSQSVGTKSLVTGHDFSRAEEANPIDGVLTPEAPLAHAAECLTQFASPALATGWGLRDVAATEAFYDGMSYHQGSVWPLFTGWAALAEYRGGQPLAGEQMLMQNVDLTWAQDPGAVTELLSGDFFVPFGRSTSHQLWSSSMVVTPTMRGLFGISVDAATNTITVNPYLPASWNRSEINNIRLGTQTVNLAFTRGNGILSVAASAGSEGSSLVHLRSDMAGARIASASKKALPLLEIPLPELELILPEHRLPAPGSRPSQLKILNRNYGKRSLTISLTGPAGSSETLTFQRNTILPNLKISPEFATKNPGSRAEITRQITLDAPSNPQKDSPVFVEIEFAPGKGWITVEFTLTW